MFTSQVHNSTCRPSLSSSANPNRSTAPYPPNTPNPLQIPTNPPPPIHQTRLILSASQQTHRSLSTKHGENVPHLSPSSIATTSPRTISSPTVLPGRRSRISSTRTTDVTNAVEYRRSRLSFHHYPVSPAANTLYCWARHAFSPLSCITSPQHRLGRSTKHPVPSLASSHFPFVNKSTFAPTQSIHSLPTTSIQCHPNPLRHMSKQQQFRINYQYSLQPVPMRCFIVRQMHSLLMT